MKNLLLAFLFLFSVSLLAQSTVNFETNGNSWNWIVFDGAKENFDVVANPSAGGLNTTDSCARLQITDVTADPWAGVFCTDFPDFIIDANNCYVKILVYKDHISDVCLKLEPAQTSDFNIPNTVIGQWEEIIFDYSAKIGGNANTLTVIPDFSANPRTYTSTSYFDEVRFTPAPVSNVNFETVGNSWNWIVFDDAKEDFDIVANPSVGGLNTTDSCAMLQITDVTADPWAGVFAIDFPDMVFDANNCIVKILVYKDHISNVGLKIEPARTTDYNIPNTVIGQWEEIVFDYSAYIGSNANTLVVIPDFAPGPPRTYTSTSYFDEIRFTSQTVPVELTSFTAAYVGNDVQLKWATATELNNRGFEIQRSANGSQFATVAFVEGHGTTTEQQKYSFVDNTVDTRTNYAYRLKQIDFNGNYEYSSVVNVGITLPSQFVLEQNYPNPFNPSTKISFAVPVKSEVTLEVYNLIGQKLLTLAQGSFEAGTQTLTFDAAGFSSGIYLVKMVAIGDNGNEFVSSKKMTLLK